MIELLIVLTIVLLVIILIGLLGCCSGLLIYKKYEEWIDKTGGF